MRLSTRYLSVCINGGVLYGLSEDVLIDWDTVLDEDIPEAQVKVILVAAG